MLEKEFGTIGQEAGHSLACLSSAPDTFFEYF
jgi:hypothetical protein